jgi:hypothetical protein
MHSDRRMTVGAATIKIELVLRINVAGYPWYRMTPDLQVGNQEDRRECFVADTPCSGK